jgi:hypothetical protein
LQQAELPSMLRTLDAKMSANSNTYQSLSSSGLKASWQLVGAENKPMNASDSVTTAVPSILSAVELRWENEGWTAEGTLGSDDAQFVLRLSAGWTVQQCLLFRDLDDPDLWLGTDSHGRWGEMNGAHRTELDGCTDIDFVNTPFTNCIPIRRLPLHVGHSAAISVAVIDIETLGIKKQTQQYTKVSPNTWRYFSVASNCEVEANVDEFGFVVDEPHRFRRIA